MKFKVGDIVEDNKGYRLKIINIDKERNSYQQMYETYEVLNIYTKISSWYSINFIDNYFKLTIKSMRKQKLNKLNEKMEN
jgi:hypothetical protein